MNLDAAKAWLMARAKEGSTWRGLVLILTALGVTLSPEQKEAIITGGLFIAGLIGALTADKKPAAGENHG